MKESEGPKPVFVTYRNIPYRQLSQEGGEGGHQPSATRYVGPMALVLLLLTLPGCTPPGRAWRLDSVVLTADPAQVDFGPVVLGTVATQSLTVTNAGTSSVAVALTVDAPFRVDQPSLDLGAGGSAIVTVSFAPADYLPAAATLLVTASSTLEVPVSGTTDADADADGHDAVPAGGDDCDDAAAATYTGAEEVCYDGVDNDCDGLADDVDCDGDGSPVDVDCDDLDPTVAPGVPETGPDGRDDDCDGLIDENLHVPGALFLAEIEPGALASVELCNASNQVLYLDRLRLENDTSSAVLDPAAARDPAPLDPGACAALAERATGYFSWTLALPFDADGDTLSVWSGDVEIDRVAVSTPWHWDAGTVYALAADHSSADENDDSANWCAPTAASWGSPTPGAACP